MENTEEENLQPKIMGKSSNKNQAYLLKCNKISIKAKRKKVFFEIKFSLVNKIIIILWEGIRI